MSKPRTAEELAAYFAEQDAINAYANGMIDRDKLRGYPYASDVGMGKNHPYDMNLRGRDNTGAEWNVNQEEKK